MFSRILDALDLLRVLEGMMSDILMPETEGSKITKENLYQSAA